MHYFTTYYPLKLYPNARGAGTTVYVGGPTNQINIVVKVGGGDHYIGVAPRF